MLCHKYARNDTNLSFLKYKITDYFQIPTSGGRGEGGCRMWATQVYATLIKGLFSQEFKMMLHEKIRNDDF